MWSKFLKTVSFTGMMVLLLWNVPIAHGQQFVIPWFTIDGGGGNSTGGAFELEAIVGQHDAGTPMTGGRFEFSGGFWVEPVPQDPVVVVADSFLITRGDYVSGGVAELAESDNADLAIQRAGTDIQARTEFEVKAFSPVANPSSMEVTLEGAVFARSDVVQSIELFDYVANDWELIDSGLANRFSDTTVTIPATGNLSRFVETGTLCVEVRIRYESVNPRQRFSSNTDLVSWTIDP